jgi:hypothetical protein
VNRRIEGQRFRTTNDCVRDSAAILGGCELVTLV